MQLSDEIYKQIMWDYNIPKEDIEKLLSGEIEFAGHYDRQKIAIKIFNNLNWYSIIKIYTKNEILNILTDDFIKKLRFKEMKENYETLRKILRNETLSHSRWNNSNDGKTRYPILSNRWYRFK